MPEWYCKIGTLDYGPMSWEQLLQLAFSGQLRGECPVRRSDLGWTTAGQIPELLQAIVNVAPQAKPGGARPAAVRPAKTPVITQPGNVAAGNRPAPKPTQVSPVAGKPMVQPQAKAAVRPAVPAGVPVGVPAGMPVGVPVGVPQGAPVGMPVGVAPVAIQPGGFPPPVSGPPAFSRPVPGVAVALPPPPPRSHADDDDPPAGKRKKGSLALVIGLGVSAVVVGCVLVVVLVVSTQGKKRSPVDVAARPSENTESMPAEPISETNPLETAVVKNVSAASTPAGPSAVKEPEKKTNALPPAFQNVKRWSDAGTVRRLRSSSFRMELVNLWLAADERGTPLSAESPPQKSDSEEAEGEAGGTARPAARYVFVVVDLTNMSPKPLTYRTWNNRNAETGALLADDGDRLLELALPNGTPGVQRLTGTAEIQPQKSVRDTLVFPAPADEFQKLRLVLPHAAVSGLGTGYFGFEIPKDALTAQKVSSPVAARSPPVVPNGENAPEPEMTEAPEPTVVARPAGPKVNEDGLMSKEDFLKSINGPDYKKNDNSKPAPSPAEMEAQNKKKEAEAKKPPADPEPSNPD